MAKKITFTLSAEVVGNATSGLLLGEFNNWDYNEGIKLEKQKDGSMKTVASLEPGKTYEYRYLLNDGRWVNDQSADRYVHIKGLHVENCVINVPGETIETKKAPTKEKKVVEKESLSPENIKTPAKKTAPAKKETAAKKEAPVKKAAPAKKPAPLKASKTSTPKN